MITFELTCSVQGITLMLFYWYYSCIRQWSAEKYVPNFDFSTTLLQNLTFYGLRTIQKAPRLMQCKIASDHTRCYKRFM